MVTKSFRKVLSNIGFLFLWFSQLNSQLADRVYVYVLMIIAYKLTHTNLGVAVPLLAFGLPSLLFGPLAGVYVDRWNRKWVLGITSLIRGLLVLLVIPLVEQSMILIFLVSFLLYSATQFFAPAETASIPELVKKEDLIVANSLFMITWMGASVIGFGLGGIIVSLPSVGVKGALIIDGFTFFISALLISFIKKREMISGVRESIYEIGRNVKEIIRQSVFVEIKHGIKHIIEHRKMHFVIGLLFILSSGIGASQVVVIVFIQNALASITRDLGLLIMFFGTGLFCGAIVYGKIGERFSKVKAIFLSLILGGIFLVQFVILVGVLESFFTAAVITFFFGAAVSPIIISSNTIVHELIPKEVHGRVFSSLEAVVHLAYLVFMLLSAVLAEFVSSFYILLTVGLIFVLSGVLGIRIITKKKIAHTSGVLNI